MNVKPIIRTFVGMDEDYFDPTEIVEHELLYYNVDDGHYYNVTVNIPQHLSDYINMLKDSFIKQEIAYEQLLCKYDLVSSSLSPEKRN